MSIYQSTKVSPYVYWLTHKETGQFYIGYREAHLVPSDQDLGFFYFTSSKQIKTLKFENFNHRIVAVFLMVLHLFVLRNVRSCLVTFICFCWKRFIDLDK